MSQKGDKYHVGREMIKYSLSYDLERAFVCRETGLVEEHLVPFRTERDKADLSTFKVQLLVLQLQFRTPDCPFS